MLQKVTHFETTLITTSQKYRTFGGPKILRLTYILLVNIVFDKNTYNNSKICVSDYSIFNTITIFSIKYYSKLVFPDRSISYQWLKIILDY